MTETAATLQPVRRRFGESTLGKLLMLFLLVMLLLIPVARVTSLVRERMGRQDEVATEIAGTWGGSQTLIGPMLAMPYSRPDGERTIEQLVSVEGVELKAGVVTHPVPHIVRKTEPITRHHRLHSLPTTVRWQATVTPEIRYRGLFEVVVYEARLRASGTFERPRIEGTATPNWDRAVLVLGLPDVHGLEQRARLVWDGEEIEFLPGNGGTEGAAVGEAIHAPLPGLAERSPDEPIPFAFELVLRGSGDLRFLPVGEETTVELAGPWSSPGFTGAFLPTRPEIGPDGFSAVWEVPYFGRPYPQSWTDDDVAPHQLLGSAFGVSLVLPADGYQQTERSVKYAVLFILLTFGTFFLLEVLSPVRLHAMHYLLVGSALVLFYVLLLALSEHLGFAPAYGLAATATVGLVGGYSRSILASRRWAVLVLSSMAVLYGYLYVLLRLEDYSLLFGALGLFAALALVMRLTRKLDWFTLKTRSAENG